LPGSQTGAIERHLVFYNDGCAATRPQKENALIEPERRALIQKLDQISQQMPERHYEETRAKIHELFQKVKMPGQNDNGAVIKST
jgi:hypothetical protein